MIISGLCVSQQWQDKGFRSRLADAMTHAVAIVCKFYTRRCVGSVRTANFSVASWQKTTCYNWDQIAILCWITLFEKDLRLHWSGICDFYLLNCNRERSYYKYCQCSQNFLWVKKWNWSSQPLDSDVQYTIYSQYRRLSYVCSFQIAFTASRNMYLLFWCFDLWWMTWFRSMYTFVSSS